MAEIKRSHQLFCTLWSVGGNRAEVERAREVLRRLIELSGMSQSEVERRLVEKGFGTDVTRLLSGRLDLKLRHVVDISTVLGVHPLEFFRMVFREPEQRSPFLQKLDDLVAPGRTQRAARPPVGFPREVEDLKSRISELIRELKKLSAAGDRARSR